MLLREQAGPARELLPNRTAPAAPPPAAEVLRVLVVHNGYQLRGGEDAVADDEVGLLRRHGHVVQRYGRHNDEVGALGRLQLARDTVWSDRTARELREVLAGFRPDVVHVHNSFPLISPSLYWAAHGAGVPVVQTLHNFRLLCPQGLLLREGRVCEDCVGRVPWRGVLHRCYRGSATQTAAVAVMVQAHRALGTWRDKVDRYIALNEFCRTKFVEGGLPAARIRVKPNFVDLPAPPAQPRRGFLFVGRLAAEKGIGVLADAQSVRAGADPVRVAGTGPESDRLQGLRGLQLLGSLTPPQVYGQMASAVALVVPSIWYENFPRTVVEAYANELPVIASRLGALASLVEEGRTGLLFAPGDAADLARQLDWAAAHPQEMRRMGLAARRHYEAHLGGDANHLQLTAIYREAIAERHPARP